MRRFLLIVILVAAVATPVSAQSGGRIARTISEDFDASGYEGILLRIDVGEVEIIGVDGDTIQARIDIRCARDRNRKRCEDRAEDIALDTYDRRGRLVLNIDGTGLWRSRDAHVVVALAVPRALATEIELGTGKLTVEDIAGTVTVEMSLGDATLRHVSGDVVVDLGIGAVSVTMSQDVVGEVTLDNGIGETELRHRDGRNAIEGILGGIDIHWDNGPGAHTVKIDLNVGEIFVRLQ